MRLDKYLCACQVGTRSEVKKLIKAGKISVNGTVYKKPEDQVEENADVVNYNGKTLVYEEYVYYLLNKSAGCVTATSDHRHPTVMESFPENLRKILTPVGRLDLDTEGALIFTNDGNFTHHILSPNHHVPKTYYAKLDAPVLSEAIEQFANGIDIGDDKPTLPAILEILPVTKNADGVEEYSAKLTIREGRYHQVKRMFHAMGAEVIFLKRLSIGTITLDGLDTGAYRKLTDEEVAFLKA